VTAKRKMMRLVAACISLLLSQTRGFHFLLHARRKWQCSIAPDFLSVSEGKGHSLPISLEMTGNPCDRKKGMEGVSLDNACC